MYRYVTKEDHCVRHVFPDGRAVNLLGNDVNITLPGNASRPKRVIKIPGATDKDFELILNDPRYASIHGRIKKVYVSPKKVKRSPKKQKDAADKSTKKELPDSAESDSGVRQPNSKGDTGLQGA